MRTIRDCNATNLLLCISFIYLLKCKRNGLNNNHNGILCVCVCVCVRACVRASVCACARVRNKWLTLVGDNASFMKLVTA